MKPLVVTVHVSAIVMREADVRDDAGGEKEGKADDARRENWAKEKKCAVIGRDGKGNREKTRHEKQKKKKRSTKPRFSSFLSP